MATLLEPLSNTRVHDHGSRLPRHSLVSTLSTNDSYGDLWGENSFQSSIESKLEIKRPDVIHESSAEKRWSGDSNNVPPPMDDEFLSTPIKMPLKDEIPAITAINEETRCIESKRRQRRGSNDLLPIRPDRRSSATNRGLNTNALNISKGDLSELMHLDSKTEKLDDYLEETKNADSDINSQLSSPLVPSLNDEVDGDDAAECLGEAVGIGFEEGRDVEVGGVPFGGAGGDAWPEKLREHAHGGRLMFVARPMANDTKYQ